MLLDKDIREPFFDYLESVYGKVRIIEEKMVGSSRADAVAVIADALMGVEIKSDSDDYSRLASQVRDYDRYFDYNIVVAGSSHGQHVSEHVPGHWGIITAEETDKGADFYFLRRPSVNEGMQIKKKLELLWRPELAALQERFDMPKYESKSKRWVVEKIARWTVESKIDIKDLNHEISELLFERDYEKLLSDIAQYRKQHSPGRRRPKKSTSVRRARKRGKA